MIKRRLVRYLENKRHPMYTNYTEEELKNINFLLDTLPKKEIEELEELGVKKVKIKDIIAILISQVKRLDDKYSLKICKQIKEKKEKEVKSLKYHMNKYKDKFIKEYDEKYLVFNFPFYLLSNQLNSLEKDLSMIKSIIYSLELGIYPNKKRNNTTIDFNMINEKPIDIVIQSYSSGNMYKSGNSLKMICPLPKHDERTCSFFIDTRKNVYHCFGCQKGGNVLSFIMEMEGCDIKTAAKIGNNF